MVVSSFDSKLRTGHIILRPNRSSSWRANLHLLASISLVSITIAGWHAAHGLWMLLPFSVIEMSALAGCLYYCVRATHRQEVITFSEEELRVERGIGQPERQDVFQRFWARILVARPRNTWYRTRIAIRSHGRELEIGDFLNAADKQALITELRQMVEALTVESR